VDVIVEKIESDPDVPGVLGAGPPPAPPAPTVTGTLIDPNPETDTFVPPGKDVRYPPAPPPPDELFDPPPPPPATTK
jgi:hypothetical protein